MSGRRRGFTLMEVLVALALVMLLSWSVFSVVTNVQTRRDRLVEFSARQSEAGSLFELLERDLMCALAADREGRAGVAGTSTGLRVVSRACELGPELRAVGERGDLVISEYKFDVGTGEVTLSRGEGAGEVVASGVRRFELRFFDGGEWRPDFDSVERDGLPVMVEVSLWFGAADAQMTDTAESLRPDRVRQITIPDGGPGEAAQ